MTWTWDAHVRPHMVTYINRSVAAMVQIWDLNQRIHMTLGLVSILTKMVEAVHFI